MITHCHQDHIGGAGDIIKLLIEIGQPYLPPIMRYNLNLIYYQYALDKDSSIDLHVLNVRDNDVV